MYSILLYYSSNHINLHSFPTRRSSDLFCQKLTRWMRRSGLICLARSSRTGLDMSHILFMVEILLLTFKPVLDERAKRSEERFSRNAETDLVCRLLLEKKKRTHDDKG